MAGAITRSAPTSSDRVRPRTRVSPARSAIAMKESAAGHRPPALQSMARTTPCSPAISRARRTGTTSVTPPSTSRRPFHAKGGKTPGKLQEARTASRRLPSRKTTPSPVSTSVARTTTGTRRPSKVALGRNSSMSAPRRLPERSPPPQPRTHIQGCRREACSTSCARSAPPAQAAATSDAPLTAGDPRDREALALERPQDAGVRRGVGAAPGEREVEGLHGSSLSW